MRVYSVNHSLNVHVLKTFYLLQFKPFFCVERLRIDLSLLKRAKRHVLFTRKRSLLVRSHAPKNLPKESKNQSVSSC